MSLNQKTSRCGGVTLIELAVVLALLGIVGGVIGTTLVRQQRFYRGASELLSARESVRDATEVLSTDIRGMSLADTATLLADSAFEFFSTIGSGVVCAGASGVEIGVAGTGGARGNALTAILSQPDTGDLALFYRVTSDGADRWDRARIAGFASRSLASSCPNASPFAVGAGGRGFVIALYAPLPGGIGEGAPVRFVRRGRYSLYHASDGEWYLGYRRCGAAGAGVCGAIQPLSGPYRAYSPTRAVTGLLFEYFDGDGNRITDATSALALARVQITVRAESHHLPASAGGRPADSAVIGIAIRNSAR